MASNENDPRYGAYPYPMDDTTQSSSAFHEWPPTRREAHSSVCLSVHSDQELPLMTAKTGNVPKKAVRRFLDDYRTEDSVLPETASDSGPCAPDFAAEVPCEHEESDRSDDAATIRIRIHAPKRSPSGKIAARPILKMTTECDSCLHDAGWTESSVMPSRLLVEESQMASRTSPRTVRQRRVKFEGFLTTTSDMETEVAPVASAREYIFEQTLSTLPTEDDDPFGRMYGEGPEQVSEDPDLEPQYCDADVQDPSTRPEDPSSRSPMPSEEQSTWKIRLSTESSGEEFQLIKPTSVIVITERGDIIGRGSPSMDDLQDVVQTASRSSESRSEESDSSKYVDKPTSLDVASEPDVSVTEHGDRGTRFSWSVTDSVDELPRPSLESQSYPSSVPQGTISRTTFSWKARKRAASGIKKPPISKRRQLRSSSSGYTRSGRKKHSREDKVAAATDDARSVKYPSRTRGLYKPPSFQTVGLYPRRSRDRSAVSLRSQPSDESGFRIRISARRGKPVPSGNELSVQAFGDTHLPPEAKRPKRDTQRRMATFPCRYYGGEYGMWADPLSAYIYSAYSGNQPLESECRYPPRWQRKARRSVSLDTATKRAEDQIYFGSQLPEELISSTSNKTTGASGSCPLLTGTFRGLEEYAAPGDDLVTEYPPPEDEASISYLAFDAQLNDAEALLQPSVRRVPLPKRVATSCRAAIYTSLALAVTFVSVLMFLAKNIGVGEPVFEIFNDTNFALREDSSSVREYVPGSDKGICDTATCRMEDRYVRNLLSWELDPCDNFYRFVCGRWNSAAPKAVPGRNAATARGDLAALLEKGTLTTIQLPKSEFSQLRGVFSECMDTKQLDQDGWSRTWELLWLATLDGFPFTSTSTNSSSVWTVAARVLRMTGTETLVNIRMLPHPSKRSKSIIAVSAPEVLSPAPNDVEETARFYSASAHVVATVLDKRHRASTFPQHVADFAKRLELLASNSTLLHDPARLDTLKTTPDLRAFVSEVFADGDTLAYSGARTDVLIQCPGYYGQLLMLVSSTKPYVALNYIVVRLLIEISPFVPSEGDELVQALTRRLYGRQLPPVPRWRLCVRMTERAVPPLFLDAVWTSVETQFTVDTVLRHVKAILKQLVKSLDKLAILDENARTEARRLLNQSRVSLFRPAWLSDEKKLRAYMSDLPNAVPRQGLLSYYRLRGHSFWESLREDNNDHWLGSAFDTDCRVEGRTVYLPFAMFNFSLLNVEGVDNFLLPHVGTRILGCFLRMVVRDMTFNGERTNQWWPDLSHSLLGSSQLCFEQWTLKGVSSSALLELTAALKPSLDMYTAVKGTTFDTLRDYGVCSLFFVYYALGYCEKADNSTNRYSGDTAAARLVNVPLWNNRLFQETFRCAVGSGMNPVKKCLLWNQSR